MGRRDLSDMYQQAQGHTAPEGKCEHQVNPDCTMLCNTFSTLKLPNLPFTIPPLYIITGAVYGYGFLILMFL